MFQVPVIQMPAFQFPSPEDIERNGGTVVGLLSAAARVLNYTFMHKRTLRDTLPGPDAL